MATVPEPEVEEEEERLRMRSFVEEEEEHDELKKLAKSFLGLSFSVMLAHLPNDAISIVPRLTSEVTELKRRLATAEEQVRQMKSRRVEDSKANARVVEIFASHRNAWQEEEKRLLNRIHEMEEEREDFMNRINELEREVSERDEMIGFMSRREIEEEDEDGEGDGDESSERYGVDHLTVSSSPNAYGINPSSNFTPFQDLQYESLESVYRMKHFVPRESPWKIDSEGTGVSAKLRLLEEELLNLEKVCRSDISKVPSLLRKQAKRYQALSGKIDDLCRRMQSSDPCDATLGPEFRTQRQTEFLLECFRLQQRASETGQKLVSLQTEITRSNQGDQLSQAKMNTGRSLDLIKNNLKEVQRNLEIWLARIIGDLEGILARDGASRVREFYVARYPFVQ
ncbi:uncharacterized protein LOC9311825 isoform X3 [Arabidopsis lyrata subsp. lyrata]|uniref:uncharacterized protein LOC9311825 isoform X3 n=1 Tax=Arabidopsis lyrata subsp. lyrata TaxID=81972 RepID=UPI000A29C2AA|nr:uncharacterized protein LOC9311825 isoform X3 [Arabidopsis lyrata subsp. lyrata]|eukprot:XP_020880658.1 uncharacterized protein LOC9311825 isoform X3 [Arabidopsis lyrata subsp. lyrata]